MKNRLFSITLVIVLASFGFAQAEQQNSNRETDSFSSMQERIRSVANELAPSVVHISAILKVDNMSVASTATGIIADAEGHIFTNYHVVDKAEKINVTVKGIKQKVPAEIVGTDQQTDLAVIKLKPETPLKLTPARFGDSSKVNVGDWVIAIGNPYGLEGTVSFGIISAIQRNLNVGGLLNEFIQTDAMIDHGSSGGPLVNIKGEVIGINSRGQGRGIGFTIPINIARDVEQKLIQKGQVERGWLGVSIQPLDRDLASMLEVPNATGVVVNQVHEGSSAARGGLKAGDIITQIDGKPLEAEDYQELRSVRQTFASTPVGKEVKLRILRNGKSLTISTAMAEQPRIEGVEFDTGLGFQVKEITRFLQINERLLSRQGVYVSFVEGGSVADEGSLQKGDVVVQVNKKIVKDLKEFRRATGDLSQKKRTLLQIQRGNDLLYVLLKNDRKKQFSSPAQDS